MRRTMAARSATGTWRQRFCEAELFCKADSISAGEARLRSTSTEPSIGETVLWSGGGIGVRPWLLGGDVGGGEAAVDEELGAGHVRRLVAREEERGLRDLLGFAEAAHRHVDEAALSLLVRIQ